MRIVKGELVAKEVENREHEGWMKGMSALDSPQRKALTEAYQLLNAAGILLNALLDYAEEAASSSHSTIVGSKSNVKGPSVEFLKAAYQPSSAEFFGESAYRYTCVSYASALVDHPLGTVVEFPESGHVLGEAVAH